MADPENKPDDPHERFALFDLARQSAIVHAVQTEQKTAEQLVAPGATMDDLLETWRAFMLSALHTGDALQAAVAADVALLEYRLRIERAYGPLLPERMPAAAPPAPAPAPAVASAPAVAAAAPVPQSAAVAEPTPELDTLLAQAAGLAPIHPAPVGEPAPAVPPASSGETK
jgi:hypothetical protein